MFKKIVQFFKEYRLFGLVLVAAVMGLALDIAGKDVVAHWILALASITAVIPLLWDMLQTLRDGKYGVDILAATAIISSVLLHEYWAGMIIVLMLTGGEALEDYAERRAKTELSSLLKRKPKQAHLLRGRKVLEINVQDIKVGDKLIIYPGEVVPVDGEILDGSSSLDESSLTGESLPVTKSPKDQVLSGTINMEGALTVRAVNSAADSQYEQIIKLVKSASSSHSHFVRLADRYSIPFTVTAFIIAGGVWALSGQAIRFLEVIVVATPCPLLLAAPIALISGMSRAAKFGVIVKTGSNMEKLAETKTIAFDKTGTLTKGEPIVDSIKTYHGFSSQEVLAAAAALEQNSTHILARAILDKATSQKLSIKKAKHTKEISGQGLSAQLSGKSVLVGRLSLLENEDVNLPASLKSLTKQTTTFVAINGKLAGVINFVDQIRPEAKSMMNRLRKAGVKHFMMVTGDNEVTAQTIAEQLGIDEIHANCLPADKISAIEAAKYKPVVFVGDGVNDAPVLTASDTGIALGARGSTAASESADVVIMQDNVERVADAYEISQRTFFIGKQSILIGIFISLGLMGVFATGKFQPIYGAALQELVDVTVIFNALRAHSSGRH